MSGIAPAFLNTPVDPSKPLVFVQAPRELQYSEPLVWTLKRQLCGLTDAPESWQARFSQIMINKGMVQMKSDSCTFLKKDQLGHVQLAVMAYIDDLVISQMVKGFTSMIQEYFTLKHVNLLTSENPVEFLGRTIKRLKSGNITMEFSQKFIDELLKIFEVTSKVTIAGLKLQALSEDEKALRDKVIHQKSGELWENFFGWLNSEATSSIPLMTFQDHSSIRKIKTSKISFTCSSMSIRPKTLFLSWSLSFPSVLKRRREALERPRGSEKGRLSRADFPLNFSENLGFKPPFVSPVEIFKSKKHGG